MRNRTTFFLTLILPVLAAVMAFNTEAAAQQWEHFERKSVKPQKIERKPVQRRDNRHERTIVVRPSTHVSVNKGYSRIESYSRNERYLENNGNIAQIARLNGYEDGLYEGRKDARDGDRFDPFGEHHYEDGAEGYKSRYGNRETYKQLYRQSFLRGYREAFNRYLGSGAIERQW
jgi:transposase-like protein